AKWLVETAPEEWAKAIFSVIKDWRERDPQALLTWMSQLPADARHKVANQYPRPFTEDLPKEIKLLESLSDNQLRDRILEHFMSDLGFDRENALEALQKCDLSNEQK